MSRLAALGIQVPSLLLLLCPYQAAPTRHQDGSSSRTAFQLTRRTVPSFKGLFSKLHTPPSLIPHWPGLVTLLEEGWEMWT